MLFKRVVKSIGHYSFLSDFAPQKIFGSFFAMQYINYFAVHNLYGIRFCAYFQQRVNFGRLTEFLRKGIFAKAKFYGIFNG
jgi:hypothetical protein